MPFFTTDWSACFPSETGVVVNTAPPLTCAFIAIQNLINFSLVLAAVIAVFFIMYAAFQFATSGGDKEKIDAARKRITYAIIGLIVIFFAFALLNILASFTGIDPTQLGLNK